MAHREEHANVLVAQSLNWVLGGEWVRAERSGRADRKLPDFEVRHPDGAYMMIEAKYAGASARAAAEKAALGRFGLQSPPDIAGALVYSEAFRQGADVALQQDAPIEFAFMGREMAAASAAAPAWNWRAGTVYDLAQSLRLPRAILGGDKDEIAIELRRIEAALDDFAGRLMHRPGAVLTMGEVLQVAFTPDDKEAYRKQKDEAVRVAGLIVIGAFMFQFALADKGGQVRSPAAFSRATALAAHWRYIIKKINYVAVFEVAHDIVRLASLSMRDVEHLRTTAQEMKSAASGGADLIGQVYHKLLAEKSLGAYFTSIPAATMVCGIALSPALNDHIAWGDRESIRTLRVVDPACGSGTLLSAACWQMRDNYARAKFRQLHSAHGGAGKLSGELRQLHRQLLENTIWGYDILANAVHLTTITLGLMEPDIDFEETHLSRVIIGQTDAGDAVGSLDMFERRRPLFNRAEHVEKAKKESHLPPVDFCIMNPPFVRGQKNNVMFAFLADGERERVHARIRDIGKKNGFSTDKGLGAAFLALACQDLEKEPFVKSGGRLAVILPAAAAVGMSPAWERARRKLMEKFDLEFVIVSRDAARPNFSNQTALQECVWIARKRVNGDAPQEKAIFVALHNNPVNNEEAMQAAQKICAAAKTGADYGSLSRNGDSAAGKVGEFARLPYINRSAWRGVAYANLHLAYAAEAFISDGVLQPFVAQGRVAMKKLGGLVSFGKSTIHHISSDEQPDKKRIEIVGERTPYPCYYPSRHKAQTGVGQKDMRQIWESPDLFARPLPGQEGWMQLHFHDAGRLLLAESIRFNTFPRAATLMSEPVWASHYHPMTLHNESEEKLKALAAWLNSTPSILLIAHYCLSTHGAKISLGVQAAAELPVPDLDALEPRQLRALCRAFDAVEKHGGLQAMARLTEDPARQAIDAAISAAFDLGDLAPLRAALAAEPIISNGRLEG